MGFRKKIVLITGATSAIGETTSIMFAKENANLVLVDRDAGKLRNVAEKCEHEAMAGAGKPLCMAADLKHECEAKRVVDGLLRYHGRLDVLVNNAGEIEPLSTLKSEMRIFDETFDANVRAVYQLTMLLANVLMESRGCVINVPGVHTSSSYFICYSMAKSALDNFTELAARKLGAKGVRVNSVNPGNVQLQVNKQLTKRSRHSTMMQLGIFKDDNLNDGFSKLSQSALNKTCEVREIASAVLYLASEQATSLTGAKLGIDDGLAFCL